MLGQPLPSAAAQFFQLSIAETLIVLCTVMALGLIIGAFTRVWGDHR